MKLFEMFIIIIQLTSISSKRYKHISSESVENILYYKGCNHKQKSTVSPVLRSPPQKQECKMLCTMCCGDRCVDSQHLPIGRQTQTNLLKPPQANTKPREGKKPQKPIQPIEPLPERRVLGFTREYIKTLISKDEDIRKILKDLVRVTMQKVDLMQVMNAKRNVMKRNTVSDEYSNSENES